MIKEENDFLSLNKRTTEEIVLEKRKMRRPKYRRQ